MTYFNSLENVSFIQWFEGKKRNEFFVFTVLLSILVFDLIFLPTFNAIFDNNKEKVIIIEKERRKKMNFFQHGFVYVCCHRVFFVKASDIIHLFLFSRYLSMDQWTVDQVGDWLKTNGLEKYATVFYSKK